jgi:trehalose 6-phosphate phosphatase
MNSMNLLKGPEEAKIRLLRAERIWLFLDYDGTLADFAKTPDDVEPSEEVIAILTKIKQDPKYRLGIISGRRLEHVQRLVPVKGILLAGTYGVELLTSEGKLVHRLEFDHIRPTLDALKPVWKHLSKSQDGFYLEDKGWTLAIHARFADEKQAGLVLTHARAFAEDHIDPQIFRILGGHKFLEVGPILADKGSTIEYVLKNFTWEGAVPVYIGDDDKDEAAFAKINQHKGIGIVVSAQERESRAVLRLESPRIVRQWLDTIIL